MIELPGELAASPQDRAEAEGIVARFGGGSSVAASLAEDLADAVRGREIAISASGDIGRIAAGYWARTLGAAGAVIAKAPGDGRGTPALIHLHGGVTGAVGYSPTGRPQAGTDDAARAGELVGEVIAQGVSAAARYVSLATVADALAAVLRSELQ
jgi:hypothetical protein